MTPEFKEWFFPMMGALFGGVGVYAAIRADLADLKARMMRAEIQSDKAHQRIDDLLASHRGGN